MMENNILKIIQEVKNTCNPTIKAKKLSFYLSDCLKKKEINIYEAYLLHWEIINYTREGYILPAWNGKVQISTCLAILNQKLLAVAFDDIKCTEQLIAWGLEALKLCTEKRTHYIMDQYSEFINVSYNSDNLLQELLSIREKYRFMSTNAGPYHVEVFPYHYYEPEKILLEKRDMSKEKNINMNVETMLIELNI